MDSMRRPVGHLPPTVYWRRRVLVLLALALLIALVAWACTGGGDSDDKKNTADGKTVAPSSPAAPPAITPGATGPSGAPVPPASTGGGAGAPVVGTPGASGSPGAGGEASPGSGSGGAGGDGGSGGATSAGGSGGGRNAPGVPQCTPEDVRVQTQTGDPAKTKYSLGQSVDLKLIVTNIGTRTCSVDLGSKNASVEVFSGSDRYWSSADCVGDTASDVKQLQPGEANRVLLDRSWSWTRSNANACSVEDGQTRVSPGAGAGFYAVGQLAGLERSGEFRFNVAGK